jgi:hypothetical protein
MDNGSMESNIQILPPDIEAAVEENNGGRLCRKP